MSFTVLRPRPDVAVLLVPGVGADGRARPRVVAAVPLLPDGGVREIIMHARDPSHRFHAKRWAVAQTLAADRTQAGIRTRAAAEPDVDAALALLGIETFEAPYPCIDALLAAVHDEVWAVAACELTWRRDEAEDGSRDWLVTFRCPARFRFRFHDEPGGGQAGRESGQCYHADGRPLDSWHGVLGVSLPASKGGVREAAEVTFRVRESRAATEAAKEALVAMIVEAIGASPGTYSAVFALSVPPQTGKNTA